MKPKYEIQENRDELRVSIVNTGTGETYLDYEYNDPSERGQQLLEAILECRYLNAGVPV